MSACEYMFHGVSRRENGDGTVTLTLNGWRYTSNAERRDGAGPVVHASAPCLMRVVPAEYVIDPDGIHTLQVVESRAAAALAAGHCGDPYTAVWQGKGWTVEIRSGYPLWQMTG